jgi:hypothetical protein
VYPHPVTTTFLLVKLKSLVWASGKHTGRLFSENPL